MDIVAKIIGGLLAIFSIFLWIGHRQYVKRKLGFQYATAYQMVLVTFTSVGLLVGCRLWILLLALVLWFFMQGFVISWRRSNRRIFNPTYILFVVVLLFAADFCWAQAFSLLGWIVSFITTIILYFICLTKAFPLERREWK